MRNPISRKHEVHSFPENSITKIPSLKNGRFESVQAIIPSESSLRFESESLAGE